MGFDAQAFATAFLEGQAKDIKERFAKAEKLREEELAKAERNLPLYKKRLQQKKNMLSMANTLKDLGVDRENIMYFAKDGPETLKTMYNIILNKNQKLYDTTGEYLSKEQLNGMMKMPQEFAEVATEYKSLGDFLDKGYSLSEQNDSAEKPENAEIMSGNFLMGLMGYGAKERVKERLETEKFIGDVSIADLNRLAAQEDFSDPTGGTFDTAVIDPAAGPRIISSRAKESILLEQDRLSTKYKDSEEKRSAFVNTKFGKDAKIPKELGDSNADVGIKLGVALDNDETEGEIGQLAKEFKRQMEYEAFKDASSGYNLGRAEIKQVNPAFLTLYDEFGEQRDSVDYINNEAFMQAIKNNTVLPGTYTVLYDGKVETVTVDQERINQLRGTD
jgi:hypothetical protein